MGDTKSELQLVVSLVDKATAQLTLLSQHIAVLGKASEEANKKSAEGFGKAEAGVIGLNQALELAKKGFDLLSNAMRLPIHQFGELLDVSFDLVRSYDAQFLAQTELRAILQATGQGGEEQAKALEHLADSLSKVTRFSDDAIVAGQDFALSTGLSIEQVEAMSEASLDLAQRLRTDAAGGFQAFTRAVQTGGIRGLKNDITDAKTESQRFADVLAFVQGHIDGIARAAAIGGAGGIIRFENAFGDLKEQIGEVIESSDDFRAFIQLITDASETLQGFVARNKAEIAEVFGRIFVASFSLAARAVTILALALDKTFEKIGEIREILVALELSGGNLIASLVPGKGFGRGEFEKAQAESKKELERLVSENSSRGAGGLTKEIADIADKIKDLGNDALKEIAPGGILKAFEDAKVKVKENAEAIKQTVPAIQDLGNNFKAVRAVIKETFTEATVESNFLLESIDDAAKKGGGGLDDIILSLKIVQKHASDAKINFDELEKSIRKAYGTAASAAPSLGGASAPSGGGNAGAAPSGGGGGAAAGGGNALSQAAQRMADAIVGAAGTLNAAAGGLAIASNANQNAAFALGEVVQVFNLATGQFEAASTGMLDGADVLVFAGAALTDAIKNLDKSSDRLVQAARRLYQAGDKLAGGVGQAPFEFGGIVTGPLLGRFEGKHPEAVIPLNDQGANFVRKAFGGGVDGGVTINLNVDSLELSDRGVDSLVHQISRRLADRVAETVRRR